jgi:hypothetical protein
LRMRRSNGICSRAAGHYLRRSCCNMMIPERQRRPSAAREEQMRAATPIARLRVLRYRRERMRINYACPQFRVRAALSESGDGWRAGMHRWIGPSASLPGRSSPCGGHAGAPCPVAMRNGIWIRR